MGCSCNVHLPANVRVRDVANVVGLLAGQDISPAEKDYVFVNGVELLSGGVTVEMALIGLRGLKGAAAEARGKNGLDAQAFYHFESSDGGRLLSFPSTPFWIAVANGVVDFVGGSADYSDTDEAGEDYQNPAKGDSENCPESGVAWKKFQARLRAVKPLTRDDYAVANAFAGYPSDAYGGGGYHSRKPRKGLQKARDVQIRRLSRY
jgi:hypothetical protein